MEIRITLDDIININKMIGKLDQNIVKVLGQFSRNQEELEILKLKTILFLEFGSPIFVKQKSTPILTKQKEEAKECKVMVRSNTVNENNYEKFEMLLKKVWPVNGTLLAAAISANNVDEYASLPDPERRMSKIDLVTKLAELGIDAYIS